MHRSIPFRDNDIHPSTNSSMRFHACISNHMSMYNCIHVCIYTHTYIHTFIFIQLHWYKYNQIHQYVHTKIIACIHIPYEHTWITYIHPCTHTYITFIAMEYTDIRIPMCRHADRQVHVLVTLAHNTFRQITCILAHILIMCVFVGLYIVLNLHVYRNIILAKKTCIFLF